MGRTGVCYLHQIFLKKCRDKGKLNLLKQPTSNIKVTTMFIFFCLKRKRTKRKQIQGVRDFDSLPLENPQHPKRPKGNLWKPA